MVLVNSEVVLNIHTESQANKLRKILRPTENDINSDEFAQKASKIADSFVQSRKGINNLRKHLK